MSLSLFRDRLAPGRPLFSPFFVLGDPTPDLSVEIAVRAVQAGASLLELGLPCADPTADGPEVVLASCRSLAAGTTRAVAFDCLRRIRARVEVPVNLLVFANLVHARGAPRFAREAAESGAASLLCPDVVLEESAPLARACASASLGLAQLCGPATSDARVRALSSASTAYLYLVTRQGITGARPSLEAEVCERIRAVAALADRPVAVGFGLSSPGHCRAVVQSGARIAIVGSALVSQIRTCLEAGSAAAAVERVEASCREIASSLEGVVPCS